MISNIVSITLTHVVSSIGLPLPCSLPLPRTRTRANTHQRGGNQRRRFLAWRYLTTHLTTKSAWIVVFEISGIIYPCVPM